ncbi:MAG TPA: response regulator, partial [Candidatus Cloacimonadota bacterium]|nr:response regulator [Candidatus Cloacimonadota bacterium]
MKTMKKNILVIDDDKAMLDCIRLSMDAFTEYRITTCNNPLEALAMLEDTEFSTIITDIDMPQISGLDVLKTVSENYPNIPVILITGSSEPETMRKAIHLGVYEFLKKPFEISDLLVTVKQGVEKNHLMIQNEMYKNHLETLVDQRTQELYQAQQKLETGYLNTIHAMVNAMEANDIYTRGHSERVTAISIGLGKVMEIPSIDLQNLRIGALLHDLGKIGIVSNVLNKEQSLTKSEYDIIKQHPTIGAKIISPIGLPQDVHNIILQHHEWFNGSGYPNGFSGEAISLLARIVSIADSFDAMTSKRPYRRNLEYKSAFQEIINNLFVQFDPTIGKTFIDHQKDILQVLTSQTAMNDLLQK